MTEGEYEEERMANAKYGISMARRLGATVQVLRQRNIESRNWGNILLKSGSVHL